MGKLIDLRGYVFERLTVLRQVENNKHRQAVWRCICSCGMLTEVPTGSLNSGNTKSCGCLSIETVVERNTTHGMAGTKTYDTWRAMIQRCANPNNPDYKDYGGRGIAVDEHWLKFENFLADMGSPEEGMTLERVDNEKGYSLENCIFASRTVQARNRRVRKDSKSGCTGVCWSIRNSKWGAKIMTDGKLLHLGFFDEIEDAIASRKEAELEYWS